MLWLQNTFSVETLDMLESRKSLAEPLRCFLDTSLSNRLEFNYTKVEEFIEVCVYREVVEICGYFLSHILSP